MFCNICSASNPRYTSAVSCMKRVRVPQPLRILCAGSVHTTDLTVPPGGDPIPEDTKQTPGSECTYRVPRRVWQFPYLFNMYLHFTHKTHRVRGRGLKNISCTYIIPNEPPGAMVSHPLAGYVGVRPHMPSIQKTPSMASSIGVDTPAVAVRGV